MQENADQENSIYGYFSHSVTLSVFAVFNKRIRYKNIEKPHVSLNLLTMQLMSKMFLEPSQTSAMEFFCQNS